MHEIGHSDGNTVQRLRYKSIEEEIKVRMYITIIEDDVPRHTEITLKNVKDIHELIDENMDKDLQSGDAVRKLRTSNKVL